MKKVEIEKIQIEKFTISKIAKTNNRPIAYARGVASWTQRNYLGLARG